MSKAGIDTNVLVMYFVAPTEADNPETHAMHQLAVQLIDKQLGPGLTGFVSTVVTLELQHTLKRVFGARRAQLMAVLEALVQHPFIALENEKQVLAAMATAARKNCGFQDCLLVETAALHGASTTYTFDKQAAIRAGMALLA